jgi:transcriptional regulator with XRE-family HTH domain
MGKEAIEFTGEQVKMLRKKHRLTQSQFAEKLGLTTPAICNYENGYRQPPKGTVMHMIKVFGSLSEDE